MAVEITHRLNHAYNHRVYTINFFGTPVSTTVTSSHFVIRQWVQTAIDRLRYVRHPVVGLSVCRSYYAGSSRAATLQLCFGRMCLIVQLVYTTVPPPVLRQFLLNPNYTFVGFWNPFDPWRLRECSHRLELARQPMDVWFCVPGMEWEPFERMVETCLGFPGVRLVREITFSDWQTPVLDDDQVKQATVRVYASFRIGLMIRAWNLGHY